MNDKTRLTSLFFPGEVWAEEAVQDLEQMEEAGRQNWLHLLEHCRNSKDGMPSASWMSKASTLLQKLDRTEFLGLVPKWFRLTVKLGHKLAKDDPEWRNKWADREFWQRRELLASQIPVAQIEEGTAATHNYRLQLFKPISDAFHAATDRWAFLQSFHLQAEVMSAYGAAVPALNIPEYPPIPEPSLLRSNHQIRGPHMDLLRGLAWVCSFCLEPEIASALFDLALSAFRSTINWEPPRAVRVGNTCVMALGATGTREAMEQMALLKEKVDYNVNKAVFVKSEALLAEKLGLTPNELQDALAKFLKSKGYSVESNSPPPPLLVPGEAWADEAIRDLEQMQEATRRDWMELLEHSGAANSGAPTGKWLKRASELMGKVDAITFCNLVPKWFQLTKQKRSQSLVTLKEWADRCTNKEINRRYVEFINRLEIIHGRQPAVAAYASVSKALAHSKDRWNFLRTFHLQPQVQEAFGDNPPTFDLPEVQPPFDPVEDHLLNDNLNMLRGLAWMCGLIKKPETARALLALAVNAYRKIPERGILAVGLGNACIAGLGMMGTGEALAQMALIKLKVKFGGAQAALAKAMTALAEKAAVTREDLEEMSVPSYGLTDVGMLAQKFGEFTAELRVVDSKKTGLTWKNVVGKPQKSLPAAVKKEHAEEVKELLAAQKDIEKMLPAQAERLDGLYLQRKSWPLETWRERYHDHPLVGALARRLIWNFTADGITTAGLCVNGQLVDRLGNALELAPEMTVTLWHPLDQALDVVLGWRGFLEEWEIT